MAFEKELTKKQTARILVVDDLAYNLQLLGRILHSQNWEIIAVTDGFQALESVKKYPPDLILLDVMMPGIDGFEVCRQLKSQEQFSRIPIIFLTAKNEQGDVIQGLQIGAVDYVTKPFNGLELLTRVTTHLDLKLTRDAYENALQRVRQLTGLLPICAHCASIRSSKGQWQNFETYVLENTDAKFSHGICPHCLEVHYPEVAQAVLQRQKDQQS